MPTRVFDTPCDRSQDERGSVSAFVALLLVALVALAGLVVDGGAAVSAHQAAVDEAEQAARAGAGALSVTALRTGSLVIDRDAAVRAAEAFMSSAGHPGTAVVSAGTVTVSIHYRIPTSVLGIVRITSLPVTATASAVDVPGVTVGTR
jgi:Flp pilus assembly protein TadG